MGKNRSVWMSCAKWLLILLCVASLAVVLSVLTRPNNSGKSTRDLLDDISQGRYERCIEKVRGNLGAFSDERVGLAAEGIEALRRRKGYPEVPVTADFLRRRILYSRIASRLKRTGPRETIMAAFKYVVGEVASICGPGEDAALGVLPETILLRGYGVCDRSAWVSCTLLENLHISSYIVYLRDPKTGISHHTIAAVELNHKLYLFDTYCGTPVLDIKGNIATFSEVIEDPASIDSAKLGGQPQMVTGAELAHAIVLLPFEAETIRPVAAALETVMGNESTVIFHDYAAELKALTSRLLAVNRTKTLAIRYRGALWDYPFRVGRNLQTTGYQTRVASAHKWLARNERARRYHLSGEHRKAIAAFNSVIAELRIEDPARVAAEYFRTICLLRH